MGLGIDAGWSYPHPKRKEKSVRRLWGLLLAERIFKCGVCKNLIEVGEVYVACGSSNERGQLEYVVALHVDCGSLLAASVASRS